MRARLVAGLVLAAGMLHAQAGTGITTFHIDPQRTGWWSDETTLTPANVSAGNFGPLWNSAQFDIVSGEVPHAYATPLYLRGVTLSAGPYSGGTFNIVFAATSNGYMYAVSAFSATMGTTQIPAGTILWRRSIGIPAANVNGDALALGIMSTPVIDPATNPATIYVTCADSTAGWQVFALDATSGNVLPGWPLAINNNTVAPVTGNGPSVLPSANLVSQRGALNLSPDGKYLYITFGGYNDSSPGWLVAVDTKAAAIANAFAGAPLAVASANAGMWAASGVAIDPAGNVYSTTGNGSLGNETSPGFWGNSFLSWSSGVPLTLIGTYTPFNYCQMDEGDIDLGGGGAVLIPNLGLAAFGGKQGNVYLVSYGHLQGSLLVRQGCGEDASLDTSLLPPGNQPQFGTPGPLNVFGPYSETNNNLDYAKARTTPAFFQSADGTPWLFVSGSNKSSAMSQVSVPPGLCRLKVVTGSQSYLAIDACEQTMTFLTPGSPVITSNGTENAILWELVANIPRGQSLRGTSQPFFLAVDPTTMKVLFQSAPGQLNEGGKYNSPLVVDGTVFIASDRLQAFGLPPVPAIASFAAAPASIVAGNSATLSWSATGATSFSVNGSAVNGTSLTVSPTDTTAYTLTATNGAGWATATTTVTVSPLPPPLIASFAPTPASIVAGQSATLSWSATGATSFTVNGTAMNGTSLTVDPTQTTVYTLTAENSAGSATATTTVTVLPPPPPPAILINSCGPAVSPFVADEFVDGGNCTTVGLPLSFTANAACPVPPLQVFTSKRVGNPGAPVGFTYTIPNLAPGQPYQVCLYFMDDLNATAGKRVFGVNLNGIPALTGFDIAGTAGGTKQAIVEALTATPNSQNQIAVQFVSGSAGNPLLSAVALVPISVSTPPVIGSFASSLASIVAGQSTTLSWSAVGATSFSINGTVVNGTSLTVTPIQTTVYTLTASNSAGSVTATTTVTVSLPPPPAPTLINSCGPAVSPFVADEFVAGGNCTVVSLPLSFTANAACPAPPLQVFGTKRTGNTGSGVGFTYTIPNLAPGQPYQVCLYFMDDLNGTAGKRVFGVNLNGTPALSNFDIAGTAGGVRRAIVEAVTATPNAQNQVVLQFVYASAGTPLVSAIALVPISVSAPPVIGSFASSPASIVAGQSTTLSWSAVGATSFSINGTVANGTSLTVSPTQNTVYTLTASNSAGSVIATTTVTVSPPPPPAPTLINSCGPAVSPFVADEFVAGGDCTVVGLPLSFTANAACPVPPLQVFGTKRAGNTGGAVGFTYTIPNLTPGQPYQVCLYFMDDLNGTAGKRVFSVGLNGTPALNNFDIAGTAGGVNRAIVEALTATPNRQNQIVVQFVYGSAGKPVVSAVALMPISR